MNPTALPSSTEDEAAPQTPPGREDLPDWLREEFEDRETRQQLDRDGWRSLQRHAGRNLSLAGGVLGAFLLALFCSFNGLLLLIGCLSGAIAAFFIHIFEFGAAMGALVFAVILCLSASLSLSLFGIHPASIAPLVLATSTGGALLGLGSEMNRSLR